jgi:hypothetical protein
MPDELFHLVPLIVREDKYFDVSMDEITREVRTGSGSAEIRGDYFVTTPDGFQACAPLRLRVAGAQVPESFVVALLMHNTRIDGIDHEDWFESPDGNECEGWHRHVWDQRNKTADDMKCPTDGLEDCLNLESFLRRAFDKMRILLNRVDHGTLFDNQN